MPSISCRNYVVAIAVQKQAKLDIKRFFFSLILLGFYVIFQIFCSVLSKETRFWSYLSLSSLNLNFLTFSLLSKNFLIFRENIKHVSSFKLQNLMVLCNQYFGYLF